MFSQTGIDVCRAESVKVKRQQENEAHTRQDELEGVNGVLKQMALAIDKIGDEASSYDQQGAVEALRRQVDGHAGVHCISPVFAGAVSF